MPSPILTPAQQNLMNFLDKLATSPYSPELMQKGNKAQDQAVEENRRCSESIHETQSAICASQQRFAIATQKAAAQLDGGIQ